MEATGHLNFFAAERSLDKCERVEVGSMRNVT